MKILSIICIILTVVSTCIYGQQMTITDYSLESGLDYEHRFNTSIPPMSFVIAGGSATADIDNDGFLDLFFTLGDGGAGVLMLNDGLGGFVDITQSSGMDDVPGLPSGPLFFDYNQDEYIDLVIGSMIGDPPEIFTNNGDLTFDKVLLPEFDVLDGTNTFTITSMDYNMDGLQDLFFSHWLQPFKENHIWKNNGDGTFTNMDATLGFYQPFDKQEFFHAVNFSDINGDRYPDMLASSDFGTSQIWLNQDGKAFVLDTINVLTDENGMGGSVADFDNDGDMDWFVSSIYDADGIAEGNWGLSGNKLYINDGNGIFSEEAFDRGVANADWGWGSSFADLNNDGYLDIAVTNGWPMGDEQFVFDKTRIFLSNAGESFTEISEQVGLVDTLQGRGLSCLDYDRDGDLDIFITNINGPVKLWKNDLQSSNNYLSVHLKEPYNNPFAIGAVVKCHTGDRTQTREIRCGSNYTSQDPFDLHFGIGSYDQIDSLVVIWQDGSIQKQYNVSPNQNLIIEKIDVSSLDPIINSIEAIAYPNPATSAVSIRLPNLYHGQAKCAIVNDRGQVVSKLLPTEQNEEYVTFTLLDADNLSSGIYFARLLYNEELISSVSFIIL